MDRLIGVCSECRGQVIVPEIWRGRETPRALCQDCGALAREQLPVIQMERASKAEWGRRLKARHAQSSDFQGLVRSLEHRREHTLMCKERP